ncbi:MAG: 4a-hydroxytetrahydrobiopterin dehydratase [Thaumarchaeota archaeon]|nr:4a-hydroxytetrahydrobiopterin dehydratase [Nitrososphaerota archaeon]MDE0525178.1 4a-hydroxytetrahydrobiopterin dehydratase [Nitrososphaerota archaeon]
MPAVLSEEEVMNATSGMAGWEVVNGKLHKEYLFDTFNAAFGFMTRAAMEIEKANHHPEWLNVYNRLTIDLTTHDAGGITSNDINLARVLDSLLA